MTQAGPARLFWAFMAFLTCLRLAVAAVTPISPDEAYYWVWSKHLALSYFDHPPMVAYWIRAGTAVFGDAEFGVRWLAPLACFVSTMALVDATKILTGDLRASLMTGLLFNATLMAGIGSVVTTPDTPLLMFWCLTIWTISKVSTTGNGNWWLAIGVFAGLALLSKYTATLLGLGILCWLVAAKDQRHWFADWHLWAGGAIASILFVPVLVWNADHGWISFVKQGGRLGTGGTGTTSRNIGELVAGQIGLATPLLFMLIVAGAFVAVHRAWRDRQGSPVLLAALFIPAAGLFFVQAFFDRVQGDWPAILYPAAVVTAAAFSPQWAKAWQWPSAAFGIAIALTLYTQTAFAVFPIPPKADMTLRRMAGWSAFAADIVTQARAVGASAVTSEDYGVASILAFELPSDVSLIAIGPRWQYFDVPVIDSASLAGKAALLIIDRRSDHSTAAFASLTPVTDVNRTRAGKTAETYHLFRAEEWTGREIGVRLSLAPQDTPPTANLFSSVKR